MRSAGEKPAGGADLRRVKRRLDQENEAVDLVPLRKVGDTFRMRMRNDEMGDYILPRDLAAGDMLALRTTGAYTYSMASNYNRFPKPAVVFAGEGRHRLVVRRETLDDILRNDVAGA